MITQLNNGRGYRVMTPMGKLIALATISLIAAFSAAGPMSFKVGAGRANMQLVQFESNADFEIFTGRTDKIKGDVTFDPDKKTGSAKLVVDATTFSTGIETRDAHLRSANWLDSEKYPAIIFETTKVVHRNGDNYRVTGILTIHGVTKQITTDATVKFSKANDTTRQVGFKGDVLQIKTAFPVKLSDYGINVPTNLVAKVAGTVNVAVTVYAQTG